MYKRTTILTLAVIAAACAPDADDEAFDDDAAPVAEEQAEPVAYADWDADQDEFLNENEFDAWWAERRADLDWDLDDEDGLTREEYGEGIFGLWDENDDDRIDESEWRTSSDRVWGAGGPTTVFADWDGDGDSELDLNEVQEGLESEGLYDRIDGDRDALIDDEELADWFFDIFDADDDLRIDTTEWESTWLEG